jgi:hypothetical protein
MNWMQLLSCVTELVMCRVTYPTSPVPDTPLSNKAVPIISGTGAAIWSKLTLGLLGTITHKVVPFHAYVPFLAFLPFYKYFF